MCSRLPEPPAPEAVESAVVTLVSIGALTPCEQLTPLGQLLTKLPVDVRLGKLILYGVCFGAADEALTIAAALTSRSPFLSPMERREQADESKRQFTLLQSDHLAVLNAYSQFDALRHDERYAFARDRFLGIKTLQQIGQLKRQLLESLSYAGVRHATPRPPRPLRPSRPVRDAGRAADGQIVPSGLRAGSIEAAGRADGSDGVRRAINQNTRPSTELLAGLLCAGLWPNVAVVHAPKTKKGAAAAQHVRLQTRKADNISPDPEARTLPLPRAQPRPQMGLRPRPWMGQDCGRKARGGWRRRQKGRDGTAPPGPR